MAKKQGRNPFLPFWEYVPDGEPHVFGDRVYLYGSHDRFNGHSFCLDDYVCWSAPADDLTDWRREGVIYGRRDDPRNADGDQCLYAPDVTRGADGRYYLYYVLDDSPFVSVAVCDAPAGRYQFYGHVHYPDGVLLGTREGDEPQFDPGVLFENGNVYLYGGFCPTGMPDRHGPMVTVLESDMLTVKAPPQFIAPSQSYSQGSGYEGHEYFEAASIRKVGNAYYFIYSSILHHELCYAVSDSPTEGFRFRGTIVSNVEYGGVNLNGATVIPGLVDIHTHGAAGADFSDGDAAGLERMARYLAAHGVTSFVPASMTLPYPILSAAFRTARRLRERPPSGCAKVMGVHMEGPFFSEAKRGAQNASYLRTPDFEAFAALYDECGGLIRLVDLAPELPDAVSFARQAKKLCVVSVAHTAATYEEAKAVYEAGASHLTHLYNAMPPFLHREPGPIGAASERDNVTAELICDGLHVHPAAIRAAFKLFPGRICLISDSLRCCGMPDGEYELGGQRVFLKNGAARLEDGALAGSAINLFDGLRHAISFGIAPEDAIPAATLRPAEVIGEAREIGSISPGKRADFLVCGGNWDLQAVWLDGREVTR